MRTLSSGKTAVTAKVNIGEPVRIYRQMGRQYEPLGAAIWALYAMPKSQMKMRRKMRIYLDTSVISALFDERNPERKSPTEAFFAEIGNFETFISEIRIAQIERTPDMELRSKMKDAVSRFSVLSLTDDVEWVGREHIRHGAVPESYSEDAYHIASLL